MERAIKDDKLQQGVNGLEWLVLQTAPTGIKRELLSEWLEYASRRNINVESIMKDAITMGPDPFYEKHGWNWWIVIDETLTYLSLLRERNYDKYFKFIADVDGRLKNQSIPLY